MATVSPRQAVLTRFTVRHPHPRHLLITIGTLRSSSRRQPSSLLPVYELDLGSHEETRPAPKRTGSLLAALAAHTGDEIPSESPAQTSPAIRSRVPRRYLAG